MKFTSRTYQNIYDYVIKTGNILEEKRGKVPDIGIRKQFLTDEDIRIERELKQIILNENPSHKIYGEEENNKFESGKDVWVIDPISGTKLFIENKPHYTIIVSHVHNGKAIFAIVHDPSANETFYAEKGKGAFLNGKRIHVRQKKDSKEEISFILNRSSIFHENIKLDKFISNLTNDFYINNGRKFDLESNGFSMGLNYCKVASGECDGVVAFTKDIFPEVAGSLILNEAGGSFWSLKKNNNIQPNNKIFICSSQNYCEIVFKEFERNMSELEELESLYGKP